MEAFSALLAFCAGRSVSEEMVEQTMETLVIWDAILLIMTSL